MKILFCGDVVGRSGRDAILRGIPALREQYALDAVVVNVDNAAGGFGVTAEICKQFIAAGVDVMTGGDHIWDQNDAGQTLENEPRLLRPHNYPAHLSGTGCRLYTLKHGKKLVVLHLLGQVFHKEYLDSPFTSAKAALEPYTLGTNVDAIVVDMHAEATSEKNAMGLYLDGSVSMVVGSHTHVATADEKILAGGTAYQTDAGMCGDHHQTIIGFEPEAPMQQFIHKRRKIKMQPGKGAGTISALLVETDDTTGKAVRVERVER